MRPGRRIAAVLVLCWSLIGAGVATGATGGVLSVTRAAWHDTEWVHGAAAMRVPRDCVTAGLYATEGGGKFLGGTVLSLSLDSVAQLAGITAQHTGSVSSSTPSRTPVAADTYANPLDATAISAINLALGNGVQLGLPAGAAGLYNQWGQATSQGQSAGAAGLVSNTGAVGLAGGPADATLPDAAVITPSVLVPGVAALADATLRVGAIASSSRLDWCRTLENRVTTPAAPAVVTRSYGIARLDLNSTSAVIGAVSTQGAAAISALSTTINGLAGPSGTISTTLTTLTKAAITPVLGTLQLGTTTATTTVTLNLAPVSALLTQTLTDGVVTINLAAGTLTVRLDGLLGGANGLNGLAPNTDLVLDSTVINDITARTTALLTGWRTQLVTAATTAVDGAAVTSTVDIALTLLGAHVADVHVALSGTLGQVRAGTATLSVTAAAVSGLLPGVKTTVDTVLTAILNTAFNAAGKTTVLSGVAAAVNPVVTTALTTFGASLSTATAPVVTMLGSLLTGLQAVLSIKVNVQPDQANAPATPTARSTEYQVSALRIGVVNGAASAASVWLAQSWAGPDVELP